MIFLEQFQLNFATFLLLSVLLFTVKNRAKIMSFGKRLIEYAIISTMVAVVVEPLSWFFDGKTFFGAYFLEYTTNLILIILAPIIGGLVISYIDYYIFKDRTRVIKKYLYMHFAAITLIMIIINAFIPIYFSVDRLTNKYSNEDLFWLHYVIISLMYVYILYFVLLNRKKTYNYATRIFLFFFLLPFIGMIIQLHYSKLFFAWNSISLGILITFIYLELQPGEKDFLTKLYNRQSYEKYVNQLIESKKTFQVALLDLNSFKQINDRLGHQIGDRVLVAFGKILRDELPDCYLASRMAGDEFMLVMNEETIVDHLVEKICNKLKNHSFSVMNSLSFAYGFCKYEEGMTIDELYAVVDKNMYENKYCVLNKKKLEMN